jgi:ABC-type transport system involved in multi-copper enzyme maturation permease subunit
VIDALTMLLGPLAAPECLRASRRGWLIWVRMIPAFAAGAVSFCVLWFWWIRQQFDPFHQPYGDLRGALTLIEGMMVAFAMIMAPAVLAGSLAGEKERGSIGLLLTTRVSSGEIVLGRLAGRLCQVLMIEMATLPALLLIASMAGFGPAPTLTLLALPAGLALGGSGIALAASAMSRRGRDALLFVYLVQILILLTPLLGSLGMRWLGILSPAETLHSLTWDEEVGPTLITAGAWTLMGVVGLVLAAWRLRASCLAEADGARARRRAKRRVWVPSMNDERPMLWKELHIERVGTLGRAGKWIGGFLVLSLALGSLGLGGLTVWGYFDPNPTARSWADWAIQQSSVWIGGSAVFIGFLIQWAIGLRAAVTISSERERGTWDALLTSPLEGVEIVRGKLWGSLWALKWFVGSALLAWTITLAMGGMFWPEYVEEIVGLVVIGTFMSAIGVRTSLRSATATKAMGITIGLWLGAFLLAYAIAAVVCLIVMLVCVIGWLVAMQTGLVALNARPWFPMTFRLGHDLVFYAQYVGAVFFIIAETRLRFDRVAGRMTGGQAAVAIDRLIHGVPMAPVRLDVKEKAAVPELDEVAG